MEWSKQALLGLRKLPLLADRDATQKCREQALEYVTSLPLETTECSSPFFLFEDWSLKL